MVTEIFEKNVANVETRLIQRYQILKLSSIICDNFSNISATRRFKKNKHIKNWNCLCALVKIAFSCDFKDVVDEVNTFIYPRIHS